MAKNKSKSKSKKGLFNYPPKSKYLADIITIESPNKARKAANKLLKECRELKRPSAIEHRAKAMQQAANRAEAMLKRKNLSEKERRELKEVAKIYDKAADKAFKIYHRKKRD